MYNINILSIFSIVLLLTSIAAIYYAYRLKQKFHNPFKDEIPDTILNHLLESKFNYIAYNHDLHIIHIHNNQPEILMDMTTDHLMNIDIRDLEKYVSPENRDQARFISENIALAAQEKKNRYFEYTSTSKTDNNIYYVLCFIIYQEDGTLCTCATGVESKNIFQAREHFYNTDINPAIGHVSVGIYIRSIGETKKYDMFNMMAQHFFGTSDVLQSFNWNQEEEDRYDELTLNCDHSVSYEKSILDKDGNIIRWLQVIKRKKAKEESGGHFITTTLLDISQRKKEEVELIKTRQNLELAIGAADISIWLYKRDEHLFLPLYGKIKFLSGMNQEELFMRVFEPYRTRFQAAFERLLNGTSQKEVAMCKVREEDAEKPSYYEMQMTVSEIDKQGEVTRIVGTLKDITYQYIHKKELENQEKKIQLAIQTSDLVQWEYNNITQLFNSNNERIKSNETLLTIDDYVNVLHPDDQAEVGRIVDLMDEGRDETFIFNKRLKYTDDHSWHYTTVYGAPFEKDHNGKVIKYTGFRRDDTEWKNINERLEEEKRKAQQADKLKSAFLANMSHEIRTPLNAIVGFSQLLLTSNELKEKEEYAQIINVNNDLLLRLISDILDLSKIESGMMELKRETFDLVPFFEDFATAMKQRVTNPEVEFIAINPYRKCIVNLDRNRLAQIFTNFATNSIKYTPKGHIKMGYEYIDNGIRIYVEDTGIGIPKEKQNRIFHRFEKLDDFAQGTGLGLSICKAITDMVEGRIGFESEAGKGSTFWAWTNSKAEIERMEEEHKELNIPEENLSLPNNISNDEPLLSKQHILVAEDNDSNFMLLKSILRQTSLDRAIDGVEAVEKARSKCYTLILMDISMPRMDGLEATREIRKSNQQIPIIAVTANAFDSDRIDALQAGCNDFIAKPLKKQELLAVIEKIMNDRSITL